MTSELLKITVLYHSYLYAVRYLNALFITLCIISFPIGFRSGDSYINQLFSINLEILNAFDKGLEVRGIFLDISKAYNKVDIY